jgi:hypothetical protein
MWRRRHPEPAPERPASKAAPSFVADTVEAYLAGRYLEHAEQAQRPLHGWMALNRVAHADPATLQEIAEAELPARAVPAWRHREQVLAQRVLATPAETARRSVRSRSSCSCPWSCSCSMCTQPRSARWRDPWTWRSTRCLRGSAVPEQGAVPVRGQDTEP